MNKNLELVKKFLVDPSSVSQSELEVNAKDAADAAIKGTDTLSAEYAYKAALSAFSAAGAYDDAITRSIEAVASCEQALAKEWKISGLTPNEASKEVIRNGGWVIDADGKTFKEFEKWLKLQIWEYWRNNHE